MPSFAGSSRALQLGTAADWSLTGKAYRLKGVRPDPRRQCRPCRSFRHIGRSTHLLPTRTLAPRSRRRPRTSATHNAVGGRPLGPSGHPPLSHGGMPSQRICDKTNRHQGDRFETQ